MVNNCKPHSNSFSDALGIMSAASPQIMAGKHKEGKSFPVGIYSPHNRGLALDVCVVQCIKLVQCLTSSNIETGILFSSIYGKKWYYIDI